MIEVKHLTKQYGDKLAVNDISFTVEDGEILGLLGPNGAGKSTTMNMLTGYISSTSGQALINGIDILEDPIKAKAQIGYLPELPPLYLDMTVMGYLNFVYDLKKCKLPRRSHLKDVCNLCRISDVSGRVIKHLSKGYRQRVGLAQALINNPPILILDEPMTGLDPNQLEEIRHLIKETGKKKTVLLSTHIMQEVEAICDRVIIINQGKIVADRPIGEICTHADEGMVLRVEFSPGSDTHWLSKSELFTHTSQQAPNCWRLTSPQGKDPREALFFEAAVRRCPIIALHTEVYQLEDIFHRYTQNFPAKPGKD